MLLERMQLLASRHWRSVFPQARTMHRALAYGLGLLLAVGRRTVTSSLLARGLAQRDWSADYRLFSRSPWTARELFRPAIVRFVTDIPSGLIPIGLDETKARKTGLKIPNVSWQRDPLSPPFSTNFIRAQRFIQGSVLFPHHRDYEMSARGIPVAFEPAPVLLRPGARASEQERAAYEKERKIRNLSTMSLDLMRELRAQFDRAGAAERTLMFAVDGSFCNRTIFGTALDRIGLIARARKDAKLCFPAPAGSRRWYDSRTFTPEQVRCDENIPFQIVPLRLGHAQHEVRYKEVNGVLWRTGAKRRHLRLIVLSPLPYKVRGARGQYRNPAYLLTTDLATPVSILMQIYIDRWQIEVNHRDEKSLLGLGQAQAWSPLAAERHPTFLVALYSLLLTTALECFGPTRTSDFDALPKWREPSARPSALDLLRLIRRECNEAQNSIINTTNPAQTLVLAANA
jgi:hypothetical protein